MNPDKATRQRVISRLKDAGASAALIEHADKMGYGRDSAMWEFADMLGLVVEIVKAGEMESAKDPASLTAFTKKMGHDRESALWEFADMLSFVIGKHKASSTNIQKVEHRPANSKWVPGLAAGLTVGAMVGLLINGAGSSLMVGIIGIALGVTVGIIAALSYSKSEEGSHPVRVAHQKNSRIFALQKSEVDAGTEHFIIKAFNESISELHVADGRMRVALFVMACKGGSLSRVTTAHNVSLTALITLLDQLRPAMRVRLDPSITNEFLTALN